MNNTIHFSLNGGAGHMTINLPAFFPCSAKEIRHLDKVCIRSDLWNNDPDQIWTYIHQWMTEQIYCLQEENPVPEKDIKRLRNNRKTIGLLIGGSGR